MENLCKGRVVPGTRTSVVGHGMIWKVCEKKRVFLRSVQGVQISFCCILSRERAKIQGE